MSRWWSLVLALLLHLAVLPFATIAAVIAPTWGTTTLVGLCRAHAARAAPAELAPLPDDPDPDPDDLPVPGTKGRKKRGPQVSPLVRWAGPLGTAGIVIKMLLTAVLTLLLR